MPNTKNAKQRFKIQDATQTFVEEIKAKILALPEVYAQKLVRQLFAQIGRRWKSTNGAEIEILACGEWNFDAGPDFREAAIVIDGEILCGDIEVHMHASDWRKHGHHRDERYKKVLIHAVMDDDCTEQFGRHTVVLPAAELHHLWKADLQQRRQSTNTSIPTEEVVQSLQVLQDYAIKRLERKISYARELVDIFELETVLLRMLHIFLDSLRRRKRRPAKIEHSGKHWEKAILATPIPKLLLLLKEGRLRENVGICLDRIAKARILNEGQVVRSEIIINVVLPLVLQLADSQQRRCALEWYWEQPAGQEYGRMRRIFRHLPQDTIWQQQGMLEYFHEIRSGRQRVCELMFRYNADAPRESESICFAGDKRYLPAASGRLVAA